MSETNQAESVSVNAVLPGMSALGINPTATSVAVDIGNLLEDETISEEENENKYTDDKLYYPKLLQSIFSIKKKKITSDKLSPICKHITMINRIKCNTKSRFSSNLPGTCFF